MKGLVLGNIVCIVEFRDILLNRMYEKKQSASDIIFNKNTFCFSLNNLINETAVSEEALEEALGEALNEALEETIEEALEEALQEALKEA